MANSVTPTVALSVDAAGAVYTFHTYSTFKNSSYSFTLDEEFDEETPDGRTVRSIISLLDGGRRMLHKQLGDQPTVIERTFTETEAQVVSFGMHGEKPLVAYTYDIVVHMGRILQTMTFNGVTCTRKYAVVE